jgi:hypothetical protein
MDMEVTGWKNEIDVILSDSRGNVQVLTDLKFAQTIEW